MFILNPSRFASSVGGGNGLLTNLVSYWTLDETSGTRFDSHGSNDLTDTNSNVGTTTGVLGNCANFDSLSDILEVTDSSIYGITGAFSISAWIRFTNNTGTIAAIWPGGTNRHNKFLLRVNSGALQFYVTETGTSSVNVAGPTLSTNTTYHVVAVFEPSPALRVYVDAVKYENTTGIPSTIYSDVRAFYVGNRNDLTNTVNFQGWIDETGLWTKALTDADVASLYASGNVLSYPSFTT